MKRSYVVAAIAGAFAISALLIFPHKADSIETADSIKPVSLNLVSAWYSDEPWVYTIPYRYPKASGSYDYGNPTASEQGQLEEINRARANPAGEAAMFGFDLFEGTQAGAISGNPAQPLAMNSHLTTAARGHSAKMNQLQFFDHVDPDGLDPADRVTATGYQWRTVGENIALRASTAPLDEYDTVILQHADLFIDEGYPDRGHRVNILNNSFKEIGVGVQAGSWETFGFAYFLTTNFATSRVDDRSFVLGVVYDDRDGDGAYDEGEGRDGVGIHLLENGATTATAAAGGYGIPVSPGTYTVEARLSGGSSVQKTAVVAGENVKVDFTLDEFDLPITNPPADPVATVFVNGSAAVATVTPADTVTVFIGLDPGGHTQTASDWWIVHIGGQTLEYFDLGSFDFVEGLMPTFQGGLFAFSPLAIWADTLDAGDHLFCFGVDLMANGVPDMGILHFGCAAVTVK